MSTEKVVAEVARLTALANLKFAPHIFIVPTVKFSSLGRRAGVTHLQRNVIEINSDLLKVAPDQIIADTVPHELAHLIHYALREQDFRKGSRLAHGRYWQMIARQLGLENPTRCAVWADADTCAAAGLKRRKVHKYACGCGSFAHAGPRIHAKIQRGAKYTIKSCGHPLVASGYVGVVS